MSLRLIVLNVYFYSQGHDLRIWVDELLVDIFYFLHYTPFFLQSAKGDFQPTKYHQEYKEEELEREIREREKKKIGREIGREKKNSSNSRPKLYPGVGLFLPNIDPKSNP